MLLRSQVLGQQKLEKWYNTLAPSTAMESVTPVPTPPSTTEVPASVKPPKKPLSNSSKKRRAPSAPAPPSKPEEFLPSLEERHEFWVNIKGEYLQEMVDFGTAHPVLLQKWMSPISKPLLYAGITEVSSVYEEGPLLRFARLGQEDVRVGSMAVLYYFGFEIPPSCWSPILDSLFSEKWQTHDIIRRLMPDIKKKLSVAAKADDILHERLLYAAAINQNFSLFQHFNRKTQRKTVFHTTPELNFSVLRAVLAWPETKIRRELTPEVLAKSTTSYILNRTYPISAIDQVAITPDPEMADLLIKHLKSNEALPACGDLIISAALKSMHHQAAQPSIAPEVKVAHASVVVQLVSLLGQSDLVKLRCHFNEIHESATAIKISARPGCKIYEQACGIMKVLPDCLASCLSAIKFSKDMSFTMMSREEGITKQEEEVFQGRYQAQLGNLQKVHTVQEENEALLQKNRDLENAVEQASKGIALIKRQALTIAQLRKRVVEEAPRKEIDKELEGMESELTQTVSNLELRLLQLQLPVVPAVEVEVLPPPARELVPAIAIEDPPCIAGKGRGRKKMCVASKQ